MQANLFLITEITKIFIELMSRLACGYTTNPQYYTNTLRFKINEEETFIFFVIFADPPPPPTAYFDPSVYLFLEFHEGLQRSS